MMERDSRLTAYIDGELSPDEMHEVERELVSDPQARARVREHRDITALLRAACAPSFYAASPERLRQSITRRNGIRMPSLRVMAIAASLLLTAFGFGAGMLVGHELPVSETAELLDEISSYHVVYGRENTHLAEVPASRREELVAWLADRLGRKLDVPDLSSSGLTFAGGRMLVVNGRPVAQFLYTRPGEMPVGVCITRLDAGPQALRVERLNGLDLAWWRDGSYAYVIVGTLREPEAKVLADRVASALRS